MMRQWLIFFAVIALALGYGLGLRERAPAVEAPPAPAQLPAPIYAPAEEGELLRREVVLMGSPFVFVVEAPRAQALAAIAEATERLRALEAEISSWKPGSDVFRLNDNAGQLVKVGADTLALLQLAKRLYDETGGTFDVSIGALWDIYPFRDPEAPLPDAQAIRAALQRIGANRIELRPESAEARLPEGMRLNLGGIGKGYAAQLAIDTLKARGIANAAVSAGGDVHLIGRKHSGPWQVRIENPRWEGRSIERFTLQDRSVATSGDSQRYIVREGKRYGHILDPRSGRPAEGAQSVTVITLDPSLADAYATAVFVMGPQAGMAWVDAHEGVEALIVDSNGAVSRSRGWRALTGGGA